METIILAVHVLLAVAIISLIMIQQGKGAEAGASFGGGASQTVFGSQGAGSFLGRMTAIFVTGLFITSFALAYFAKERAGYTGQEGIPSADVIQQIEQTTLPELDGSLPAATDTDIPTSN